jgi:hypothetical protein
VVLERRRPAVSRLTLAARFVTKTGTLVAIIAVAALLLSGLALRAVRHRGGGGSGRSGRSRSRKVAA